MITSFVRSILGAAIVSAVVLTTLPASADDLAAIDPQARVGSAGWRVDGVAGEATVRRGTMPAARLAVGQVVSIGNEVQTGPGTVVFLSRDGDRLVIQPNSQMRIAEPEPSGLLDSFMQSLGSVFYDVEPRRNRSFGVTAPYVAAVVKGTKFLVTVEPKRNSVRVDEGRVLVTSENGVSSVLVDAGHIAVVEAKPSSAVVVTDSGVPVQARDDAAELHAPAEGGGSDAGAGSAVDAAVGNLGNAVAQTGNALGGAIGRVSSGVGGTIGGVSDAVGGAVGGAGGALGGAVGSAGGALGGAVGGAGGAVGGALGGAGGGAVSGAAGAAGGAVSGAAGAVGGAVSGAAGAVGGAVSGVGGAVGGVVGGVGGAVGGLLGGKP
jgi:hypothetical protein